MCNEVIAEVASRLVGQEETRDERLGGEQKRVSSIREARGASAGSNELGCECVDVL